MQGMVRAPRGMEVLLLTHGLRRMRDRSSDRGLHVPGPAASRRETAGRTLTLRSDAIDMHKVVQGFTAVIVRFLSRSRRGRAG
jgi:hypothetical protein